MNTVKIKNNYYKGGSIINTLTKPTFDDIAGFEAQKSEAKRIVKIIKNFSEFSKRGVKLPHGYLFFGPCGTGKTLFADVISGQSDVPVFKLSDEKYSSESNLNVGIEKCFKDAKECTPSVLIIDEIDRMVACGRRGETDKQEETLKTLLTEIDDMKDSAVLILATSNTHIGMLPRPLVREGRIEKHIEIGVPGQKDRIEVLEKYLKGCPELENINAKDIALYTQGFSCAALRTLVNEVLTNCVLEDKKAVFADFLEPIEMIKSKSTAVKTNVRDESVVYHEIGHFIADYHLNKNIGMINVVPYSTSKGRFTRIFIDDLEEENQKFQASSYTKLHNECLVAISGIVAAEYYLNDKFTGGESDLSRIGAIYIDMASNGLLDDHITASTSLNASQGFHIADFDSKTIDAYSVFLKEIKEESLEIIKKYGGLIEAIRNKLKDSTSLSHTELKEVVETYYK